MYKYVGGWQVSTALYLLFKCYINLSFIAICLTAYDSFGPIIMETWEWLWYTACFYSDCSLYEYVSASVAGNTPVADLSNYPTLVADLGAQQWKVSVYQIIITLQTSYFIWYNIIRMATANFLLAWR